MIFGIKLLTWCSASAVDMSRAGRGALSVSVKAAGRDVKAAVRDIGHGRHEVSFLPTLSTPHRVDVRLNGLHIAGKFEAIVLKNIFLLSNLSIYKFLILSFIFW